MKSFMDWTETLLCNSSPQDKSILTREEWDRKIHEWRDEKHRLFPDGRKNLVKGWLARLLLSISRR